jgi:hypothetical protein
VLAVCSVYAVCAADEMNLKGVYEDLGTDGTFPDPLRVSHRSASCYLRSLRPLKNAGKTGDRRNVPQFFERMETGERPVLSQFFPKLCHYQEFK